MKVEIQSTFSLNQANLINKYLQLIFKAKNIDHLRELTPPYELGTLIAGFGSNHFWVTDKISNKRILFTTDK